MRHYIWKWYNIQQQLWAIFIGSGLQRKLWINYYNGCRELCVGHQFLCATWAADTCADDDLHPWELYCDWMWLCPWHPRHPHNRARRLLVANSSGGSW